MTLQATPGDPRLTCRVVAPVTSEGADGALLGGEGAIEWTSPPMNLLCESLIGFFGVLKL